MASKRLKVTAAPPGVDSPEGGTAEYAQISPELEGYAYIDPQSNELVVTKDNQLGTAQTHLRPATRDEIEGARRGYAAQGLTQKALGLGEQFVSGATFGYGTSDSKEAEARRQVLEQQNPILAGGANLAGTLLPSIAAEVATGGAATPLLGARAAQIASFGAGTLAQAAAQEMSQAAQTDRDVEIGNIAQGLLEGAAFLGAGRLVGKLFSRSAGAAEQAAAKLAGEPAEALARASKSAATASEVERVTPTRAEARFYTANRDAINGEVNDLSYQAGNNMFGRDGSFQKAHAISYKKADIFGKMQDADVDLISDAVQKYADEADSLANKLVDTTHTSAPSPAAARSLRAQAQNLRAVQAAGDVEDAAIAVDGYKRHLDDLREKFGSPATKGSDPLRANIKLIDEVLEPVRSELVEPKIWGKNWVEKQAKENALWSGKDGIINSRALWQAELMQRAPGAAGTYRTEFGSLPVWQMRGDAVEKILGMNPSQRRQIIGALENDLAKTEEMSQIKLGIGGQGTRDAVSAVVKDAQDLKDALGEIKRLARLQDVHGAILKRGARTLAEDAGDLAQGLGAGIGGAVGGLPGAALGGIAGRGLKKVAQDLLTPVGRESKAMAIAELRANIAARNAQRASGKFEGGMPQLGDVKQHLKAAGRKIVQAGRETAGEAVGGTVLAGGALGVASMAAETQAIRELDQHGKETTERAMLALANPEAAVLKLPHAITRFQGDYPDLQTAYMAKFGDLKRLATDPEEFIHRSTQAFQGLAAAGHPEVAAKLITRLQVGAQYLLENAPPTMGQNMFQPDGDQPDDIAILQFAPIWEAVWHPLDCVRDVATQSATPSAVKALREVHPDVYARLLSETFRTLAQAGPSVDFETKRYLDNAFNFGAAVGRSFSPQFSNLLAQARATQKQPSAQSLGGESVIAPTSAMTPFSSGPTAIR